MEENLQITDITEDIFCFRGRRCKSPKGMSFISMILRNPDIQVRRSGSIWLTALGERRRT